MVQAVDQILLNFPIVIGKQRLIEPRKNQEVSEGSTMKLFLSTAFIGALSLSGCSNNLDDKPIAATSFEELVDPKSSFEACLIAGGTILESHPRQCQYKGEMLVEDLSIGQTGDTKRILFLIEPNTVTCQSLHAVDQSCIVVNGQIFYDDIDGYEHQSGTAALIEVTRTQICAPETFNDCPQDISIFRYRFESQLK